MNFGWNLGDSFGHDTALHQVLCLSGKTRSEFLAAIKHNLENPMGMLA